MDQAPIDIKYIELLQWLVDRYLIPKDWPSRLEIIKTKKSEIIDLLFQKDTPEMKKIQNMFKIFKTLPIESLSHNDFSKLNMQLIKTEEAKEKTFFGNYKSPLIYSSYILDGIYNKNNMFLAENSKIIIQNVSYEIPMLIKGNNELKYNISENESKIISKNEEIENNKEKIKNILKSNEIEFDIETANSNQIALSIIERLEKENKFETMLNRLENNLKGNEIIKKGIDIYEEFYKNLYGNIKEKEKKNKKGKKENKKIKENFKTFTPKLLKFFEEGDYLIEEKKIEKKSEEIRKNLIENKIKNYKSKYTDQADFKSYNFNLIGTGNLNEENSLNNNNDNNEKENNNDILCDTCLLNNHERNLLISDLMEISIFLEQRLVNVENKDEINLAMYNNSLKNFNLKYSSEELKKIKNNFDELINQLQEKNLIFICEIYTDENNIKSIVDIFDDIQINNKKLNNTILNLKNKNEELMKEIKENDKKITDLRKNTVQLRKMIEVFLTKNLKRKINIMGDEYLFAK